jgi:hypothetical protein
MSTIPEISTEANDLFNALAATLTVDLTVPPVTVDMDLPLPEEDGDAYADVLSVTLPDLTTQAIDGTGVFDALMKTLSLHMAAQFEKGRITGKEYGEVYLGGLQATLQQSVSFLVNKDKVHWDALLVREQVKLTQLQQAIAKNEFQLGKLRLREQQFTMARIEIEAYTAKANYAKTKMDLANSFTTIQQAEKQIVLIGEQVDAARAVTKDTLSDGSDVHGKAEQEKLVAQAQVKLVGEQFESQRAQTSDTRSDGATVVGTMGAQTALYKQQVVSYQHDSKSKAVKIMLDTWVARKTIDDGVAVPVQIDTAALDASLSAYRTAVDIG